MNTCTYCNTAFANARAFEKHKKRMTGCISWIEMHNRFQHIKEVSTNLVLVMREKNEHLERENYELRAALADARAEALINEFEWDNVVVSAPFMGTKAKRSLRNSIKAIKEVSAIRSKVKEMHPGLLVAKILVNNNNLEVILENPELTECQVCFERKAQKKGLCKVCKHCQVCEMCEQVQAIKYHRCAFCNTGF